MSVDIANESGVKVDERALERLARFLLDEMGVHPLAELSVLLVDVDTMTSLHERFMGEPGPTDVLAFPMDELSAPGARGSADDIEEPEPTMLGDVVVCPEIARRQAVSAGHRTEDELQLLCTHGVLHLLGYDHADADEQREMFGLQAQLLERWRAVVGRDEQR